MCLEDEDQAFAQCMLVCTHGQLYTRQRNDGPELQREAWAMRS